MRNSSCSTLSSDNGKQVCSETKGGWKQPDQVKAGLDEQVRLCWLILNIPEPNWVNTSHHDVDCVLGLLAALAPIKLWFNQSSHKAAGISVPSAECVIGLLLSSANACFSMNSRKTVVGKCFGVTTIA